MSDGAGSERDALPHGSSLKANRPRHPEQTLLYRALVNHFARFAQCQAERFQHTRSHLRREPPVAPLIS